MTRQEVFELLGDVDCISATLNSLFDRKLNSNKEIDIFFNSIAPYIGLDYSFAWRDSEEGHSYWLVIDSKLRRKRINKKS